MNNSFLGVPTGMAAVSATSAAASATITTVGSADSMAMLTAAATALGPIGAIYLAAYGLAQANNLAATLRVGGVHAGGAATTDAATAAVVTADGA